MRSADQEGAAGSWVCLTFAVTRDRVPFRSGLRTRPTPSQGRAGAKKELYIPDHVVAWAHGYSVRMRREEQMGLLDEATVAALLVAAATRLLLAAHAANRRDLAQATLPHARRWLRSLAHEAAPASLAVLRHVIAQTDGLRLRGNDQRSPDGR